MKDAAVPQREYQAKTTWCLVRTSGRQSQVVAFEESVVALFLDSATVLGIPKSVAAIYGICFARAEPLSFTEIRERLNISAGSNSQGLRVLRDVGALKVVTTQLDRRELFAPDLELRKLVTHCLQKRVERQFDLSRDRLEAIGRGAPASRNAGEEVSRRG